MLVLRRKAGEAVILNDVIVIRVLAVEGDRIKLGIDAPPDVIIVREELMKQDEEEKGMAPQGDDLSHFKPIYSQPVQYSAQNVCTICYFPFINGRCHCH